MLVSSSKISHYQIVEDTWVLFNLHWQLLSEHFSWPVLPVFSWVSSGAHTHIPENAELWQASISRSWAVKKQCYFLKCPQMSGFMFFFKISKDSNIFLKIELNVFFTTLILKKLFYSSTRTYTFCKQGQWPCRTWYLSSAPGPTLSLLRSSFRTSGNQGLPLRLHALGGGCWG